MDTKELEELLKKVISRAARSAEMSELASQMMKEGSEHSTSAKARFEEASKALKRLRFLRYLRLRREGQELLAKAGSSIDQVRRLMEDSQSTHADAAALFERAKKEVER